MGMLNRSIPNMYNGVSQQPPALRLPSQAQIQENGLSSVVNGLSKRPPTEHVAKLNTSTTENVHVHTINRDKFNQYVMVLKNGSLSVYDINSNGDSRTVGFPDGTGYLTVNNPRGDFSCITVADYTFVVNKDIKVQALAETSPGSLKGSVQQFIDLPDDAANGDIYEVAGDENNNFDNYFVKYNGTVWRECPKPGEQYKLDPATMPHALIANADGTFTFKQLDWDPRYVGDSQSAALPSFVGKYISDVFFHRNRLGFLADENVIFSRAGEFFSFFPETVTTIVDSDPVDVSVSHNKVAVLKHALSYNTSLMLFADQAQFQLTAKDALTPKTAAINVTTEYLVDNRAKPVSAGTSLYFAVEKGNSTNLKEYEVQPLTYNNEAADVTSHCPNYVPKNIYKLASSELENTVIALSTEVKNELYVYRYYWGSPDEKVQSSWSKFVFNATTTILNADFIDNTLYLVIKRVDGTYLEKMDFSYGKTEDNLPFLVHLDSKYKVMGVYNSDTLETTWTVPYETSGANWMVALPETFIGAQGGAINVSATGSNTVMAPGDWTTDEVYVGRKYDFKYQLSPIYYKDSQKLSVAHYKLNLKNFHLYYDNSGYFKVNVNLSGTDYEYTLAPTLGDPITVIGSVVISRGNFRFPIFGDGEKTPITITSDNILPMSIQGAEYEALSVTHSKHLTY